jgi:hypothetical protein
MSRIITRVSWLHVIVAIVVLLLVGFCGRHA